MLLKMINPSSKESTVCSSANSRVHTTMLKEILILFATFANVSIISVCGLSCFNCRYFSHNPDNSTEQMPSPIFGVACKYQGKVQEETIQEPCTEFGKPPDAETYCGTIHLEGQLMEEHGGTSEVLLRTCMYVSPPSPPDICVDFSAGEIANISNLPPEIHRAVENIRPDTIGTLCTCGNNNCNNFEFGLNDTCRNGICSGAGNDRHYLFALELLFLLFLLIS